MATGLARPGEVAVAAHRVRVPAPAKGAGKPPEVWPETASARIASVARAFASRRSVRLVCWAALSGGNPGSW